MKNRRRYLWLAVLALGLLSLSAVLLYQPWDRGPIGYENFEHIQEGMTKDEVEALLGCRHGDHSTGTVQLHFALKDGSSSYQTVAFPAEENDEVPPFGTWKMWYGDGGLIAVSFGVDKKVLDKEFLRGRRLPPDWWLFIERCLGLEP